MTAGKPGVEISKRLVLINSISSVSGRILSLTVLLWLQTYLLNRVSQNEFAIYRVLLSFLVYVPLLTGILGGALAQFVTTAYARADVRRVTEITSTMFPVCVLASLIVLAAGLPLAWYVDRLLVIGKEVTAADAERLTWESRLMFAVLVGIAAFRIAFMPFRLGLYLKQKFVLMNAISMVAELLRYAFMFALLFGVSTKVLWVVLANIPATLFDVGAAAAVSRRLVPALRFERSAFRRDLFRPIFSYGWWTLLIRLVVMLRETYSMTLLQRSTASDAGTNAFGLASMVDNQLRRNSLMLLPVMQPALIAMHATGQDERLRRTYFRFSRYLLWVFLLAALPLIVFRDEAWSLYLAEKFAACREVTVLTTILLARLLVTFPQAPISAIAFARGHSRPVALCATAIELATIALGTYLVLVADLGPLGMAIAVLAASVVGQPLLFWPLGRAMTRSRFAPWVRTTLIPGLVPSLIATPVWLATWWWSPPQTWLALGAHVALGAAVYCGAIYLFCLNASERADLAKVTGRLRRAVGLSRP